MNYIKEIDSLLDRNWLTEHIINLYRIERKQTFPAYIAAAEYVHNLMKSEGFDSELINFPADGVTTYQDKRTPIGWDATKMSLTLLTDVPGIDDPVIADFEREPLMAVKHSVSTPPEGIIAPIVTEAQMKAGEDVKGAFVLLNQDTRGRGSVVKTILDLGALGWISDHLENPHHTPDSVSWLNAGTETHSWHVQDGDRDFISFLITPRTAHYLRNACENGRVLVKAVSDGRRYESVLPVITALLPGESEKEIWIMAHMYEPLIDDDANGVVGSIGILKALRTLSEEGKLKLKYSVRVIFASEMYGYAAYADLRGGDLSKICIGGINTDGITSATDKSMHREIRSMEAVDAPGFAGNLFLHAANSAFEENYPHISVIRMDHGFGDDRFLSDSTTGLPTVWIEYSDKGLHHNSILKEDMFDVEATASHLAFSGEWIRAMSSATEDEIKALLPDAVKRANALLESATTDTVRSDTDTDARMQFIYDRECMRLSDLRRWGAFPEIDEAIKGIVLPSPQNTLSDVPSRWFDYCENFVFSRKTRGLPHDLVNLPREERKPLPGCILYNLLSDVVSRIDGKKTLKTIIREVEWDRNIIFPDSQIQTYLRSCITLYRGGYFGLTEKNPLTAEGLTEALRALGVKEGDTLLVHSSLSGIGHLPGGAKTAIKALSDAVGESGTFLAPAFTRPYIFFEGTVNKSYGFRPFDMRPDGELRDKNIYTGALPNEMLKTEGVCRSGHSTHEWVALGANAKECVAGHGVFDAPTGKNSPAEHALNRNGSVVFLGCPITSNTFIHYIETMADAPFLHPAGIAYIDESGKYRTEFIKKHLGGHRSFYDNGGDNEFYREAIKRGLHIHEVPFGMATLYRIELSELYKIGMEMFREDANATLCKDKDCPFCKKFR
ncbi:MAG: AAC(3) family N-acetyltransferase [Oscillospiraceae bacterium]|nr:AAC(3) family N-acetyltransferase [Oscillospiraceae bacterium]